MKAIKRFTALVMVLVLAATSIFTVSAKNFTDVATNHWAYDYISALVKKGVVNGYEDGSFKPNKNVTRAEWAKMLTVTADIPLYKSYKEVIDFCSEDVKSDNWAAQYLATVLPFFPFEQTESPYGKISVKFSPTKAATRLEITKSIVLEKGYSLKKPDYNLVTNFIDYLDIPEDDMKYVAVAVEHGIIKGMDDGSFKPGRNVTRAEAATILYRAYIGEKEIAAVKKPYVMSTLVDTQIDNMFMTTLDSMGNFYYIDRADNKAYKMSMRDRKKVEYYDFSELAFEDGETVYSSYVPIQIYYDADRSSMYASGYFTSMEKPGSKPVTDGEYGYIFDIMDVEDVTLFLPVWDSSSTADRHSSCVACIQSIVKDDHVVLTNKYGATYALKLNGEGAVYSAGYGGVRRNENANAVTLHRVGNDLFHCGTPYDNISYSNYSHVAKLNMSTGNFDDVTDSIKLRGYGYKGDFLYYIDDNVLQMYKINLETLKFEALDIYLNDEYIDYADMLSPKKLMPNFLVINESTFIFYDTERKAFRILEKNDISSEETVREYDDYFYSFYDNYME